MQRTPLHRVLHLQPRVDTKLTCRHATLIDRTGTGLKATSRADAARGCAEPEPAANATTHSRPYR
jgi:hypothetical protein